MKRTKRKILQVIENMKIGGAQRTVRNLMSLPKVDIQIATYDNLSDYSINAYDVILLHIWCNVSDGSSMNWPKNMLQRPRRLIVFNHDWHGTLNGGDKYIAYSKFAKENMLADREITVIPGGINLDLFSSQPKRIFDNNINIGRLSTLLPGKIDIETIEFWKEIPAAKFIIGGSGSKLQELRTYFKEDQRFEFPGAIHPNRIGLFLNKIDIFIYETTWHTESLCYVVLEAMASGCVVVAKNKGAISELIEHGYNGFLYDHHQEAIEICKELKRYLYLRREISSNAILFSMNFSLDKMHSKVMNLYEELF